MQIKDDSGTIVALVVVFRSNIKKTKWRRDWLKWQLNTGKENGKLRLVL